MPTSLSPSIPTNMFRDNFNPPPTLSEGSNSKEASRSTQGEGKAGMSGPRCQESFSMPSRLQQLGGFKQDRQSIVEPQPKGFCQMGSTVKSYSMPVDLSQVELCPFSPEPVSTNANFKRKGEPLDKQDLVGEFKNKNFQRFVSVDIAHPQSPHDELDHYKCAGVDQQSDDPNNERLLQAATEVVEKNLKSPFNREAREQAIQKLSPALLENLAPPRQKAELLVKVAKLMYNLKPNVPKIEQLSYHQVFEVMLPGDEAPYRALDFLSEALNLDIYAADLQPMLELAFDAYDEIFLLHEGKEYEFNYINRSDLYKMMGAS